MPYASQKQRAFFNANKDELEKKGVNVDEWNEKSKGVKLPNKVAKRGMLGGVRSAIVNKIEKK